MSYLYGEELAQGALMGSFMVEQIHVRGVMSVLYRARHAATGAAAAVKVLRPEFSFSSSALRRFRQEADTLQALKHPHVVQLLEYGELTDGRPYLAMEWLEGRNLAEELAARGGYLGGREVLAIAEQIAGALAAAHAAGIVHRDLKAQNVMVLPAAGGGMRVKLVDFGIAKPLAPAGGPLTSTGHALGTPIAMAPEQIRGGAINPRTDLYALGVLLYQLLTGRLPFQAPTAQEIAELHLHAPAPRVSQLAPVPAGVDAVVRRCLEKRPEDRYPDVHAALAALRQALEGAPALPARAAALYVEVAAGGDADDALLDRVDALLEEARRECAEAKLTIIAEGASFLLASMPLPATPDAEREGRARLLRAALDTWRELDALREGAPLRVALTVHAAAAGPGGAAGDELSRPARWSRGNPGGLAATREALEGMEREFVTEAVADTALARVKAAAAA